MGELRQYMELRGELTSELPDSNTAPTVNVLVRVLSVPRIGEPLELQDTLACTREPRQAIAPRSKGLSCGLGQVSPPRRTAWPRELLNRLPPMEKEPDPRRANGHLAERFAPERCSLRSHLAIGSEDDIT